MRMVELIFLINGGNHLSLILHCVILLLHDLRFYDFFVDF